MDTNLINVFDGQINNDLIKLVNARELHQFLEIGKKFSDWIKDKIDKYNFVENQDYILISQNRETSSGGTKIIEYHISLDMAKEISMVERNDKGKQARQYFIECEKKLVHQNQFKLPQTYVEALEYLLISEKKNIELEHKIKQDAPKVSAFDNASVIFPKKTNVNDTKAYKNYITKLYPFLKNNHITNILEYYCKLKHLNDKSYIKYELDDVIKLFFDECSYKINNNTVIINHNCLLTSKLIVKKELAIKYINYTELDFK